MRSVASAGMRVASIACAVSVVAVLPVLGGGCAAVVSLGLGLERGKADVRDKSDTLADGHEIVFWERRAPTTSNDPRTTLLLLHGMGGNRDHWTRFAAAVPEEIDVIALDLPGFGESTKDPAQRYDVDSQVARVHAFVQQRGLKRFHVLGNSMGGRLAAELALRFPDGIDSVVLFDPAGIAPTENPAPVSPAEIRTPEDFDALMRASFVKPPVIPGFLKQHFADEMQKNAPFSQKVRDDMSAGPLTLAARARGIRAPTLVVWGDQDRIIDKSAALGWRDALRDHPASDVVILKDTGHAPMLERPQESVALLFAWWRARGLVR